MISFFFLISCVCNSHIFFLRMSPQKRGSFTRYCIFNNKINCVFGSPEISAFYQLWTLLVSSWALLYLALTHKVHVCFRTLLYKNIKFIPFLQVFFFFFLWPKKKWDSNSWMLGWKTLYKDNPMIDIRGCKNDVSYIF